MALVDNVNTLMRRNKRSGNTDISLIWEAKGARNSVVPLFLPGLFPKLDCGLEV